MNAEITITINEKQKESLLKFYSLDIGEITFKDVLQEDWNNLRDIQMLLVKEIKTL